MLFSKEFINWRESLCVYTNSSYNFGASSVISLDATFQETSLGIVKLSCYRQRLKSSSIIFCLLQEAFDRSNLLHKQNIEMVREYEIPRVPKERLENKIQHVKIYLLLSRLRASAFRNHEQSSGLESLLRKTD